MDRNEELRILLEENHDGHRGRLRRRVQLVGMDSLKPHEALEFLLSYVIPRQDVSEQAHALIETFGTVYDVLHADTRALMRVTGMGKRAAEWLGQLGETTDAFAQLQQEDSVILDTGRKTLLYALELQCCAEAPSTWQLCLDRDYHLIYRREICPSRAWGEPLYMRDALNDVLNMRVKYVILIQFAGREIAGYDRYDIDHARSYALTLHLAGCKLVDVLIMNDEYYASMWEDGKIPDLQSLSAFERRRRKVSEESVSYVYDIGKGEWSADGLKQIGLSADRERLEE